MILQATLERARCANEEDAPRECGVYVILNLVTQRVYIGQSTNIAARWKSHRGCLNRGTHSNSRLQADWIKYGECSFRFHVASLLPPVEALRHEKALTLDALQGDCYNFHAASCPGRSVLSSERLIQRTIRLPPDLWAKIDANGLEWLRGVIRRARPPAG